jgi:DNA helicase-2/ATP-dependent DNA helicase PcrA
MSRQTAAKEYLSTKLNNEQLLAALHSKGPSLILAWAWSGKTRTLTYKIAYLVLWCEVSPEQILAVTFTNKAAREMKERIEVIMQDLSEQNNMHMPHAPSWVWTFHSMFLKILKQDIENIALWYTKAFGIYDTDDTTKVIKDIIKNKWYKDMIEHQEVKRVISHWKNLWYLPEQAWYHASTKQEERIWMIYTSYQKELQAANMVDFDDLLLLPKLLFDNHPTILKKRQNCFSHILVDEAQDTNTLQFSLMKSLAGDTANITFIGDDYQSIYRRRGAVMEQFLELQQWRPTITMYKLETNYRSLPHIVEAWNAVIKKNMKQYEKNMQAQRTWDHHIRIFWFTDEHDEAVQIVWLIKKLNEETGRQWNDFTVLYRTNAQSTPFEKALLADWIPYKIIGAFKFFERKEVKDIIGYMKFMVNPNDSLTLMRIINTPARDIGPTTIKNLEDCARNAGVTSAYALMHLDTLPHWLPPAQATKLKFFAHQLTALQQHIELFTPQQIIENLIVSIQYKKYLEKMHGKEQAEEKMENVGQLINMATKYNEAGLVSLTQFLDEVALLSSVDEEDSQKQSVKLMTVHASKWLEFPYVFLVWLEENIFPLAKAKFDDADMEEERRWMYVAITRAQDHIFLSYATSRMQRWQIKYNQPSRFLDELPNHLVKAYDMWTWQRWRTQTPQRDEGDRVKHKLFGAGTILEVRDALVIVQFDQPKIGMRKVDGKFLQKW